MSSKDGTQADKRANIPVARPTFDQAEEEAVLAVLRSGWVTQGPMVAKFEREVADYVGAAEGVAVTSATTALFLSLHALGIGPGDEVIVPSLTFIASVNSVVHAGATPVLVDVDPRTYNIDPSTLGGALTPRTRAIMPVDQLGIPAEMDRIQSFAAAHDLAVIEDAACALGSRYQGAHVGGLARLTCYSFHPRKVIVTGEGGMITTDDHALADRLRLLRHQGMSVSDLERHRSKRAVLESYPVVGYNFRLSDVLAAMGVAQMGKLEGLLAERRQIGERYDRAFADWDEVELPLPPPRSEINRQSYILRLRDFTADQRNAVLDHMVADGIAVRRGLIAVHREPCYASVRTAGSLRQSEQAADQTVILPLFAGLNDENQSRVIHGLRAAIDSAASTELKARGAGKQSS